MLASLTAILTCWLPWRARSSHCNKPAHRRAYHLRLEGLEDRTVPSASFDWVSTRSSFIP